MRLISVPKALPNARRLLYPINCRYAHTEKSTEDFYDIGIVGGGIAGLALASALSEDLFQPTSTQI